MKTLKFKRTSKAEIDGTVITYTSGKWDICTINGWGVSKGFAVTNNGEFYGEFKTLKEAKNYIGLWA